jgi:hypothetical protein
VDVLIVDPGEHVGEPCLRIDVIKLGRLADLVAGYGHLVVDECHHLSAVSFETVARALKAKYVLGLSATVTRKDGHHPIIFMQCGDRAGRTPRVPAGAELGARGRARGSPATAGPS